MAAAELPFNFETLKSIGEENEAAKQSMQPLRKHLLRYRQPYGNPQNYTDCICSANLPNNTWARHNWLEAGQL
jgi:hypothetical protein